MLLVEAGYDVFLCDIISNIKLSVLDRLGAITSKRFSFIWLGFMRDAARLAEILKVYGIEAVIGFRSLKAVGEPSERV